MKVRAKDIGDSLTLGFELVLPTLLLAFIGYKIDIYFDFFPVGLVCGVFLGAAAGFFCVARKYLAGPENTRKR